MHSKLSHSSTAISDKPTPTTEADFDKLLEDLAKFKVETRWVVGRTAHRSLVGSQELLCDSLFAVL